MTNRDRPRHFIREELSSFPGPATHGLTACKVVVNLEENAKRSRKCGNCYVRKV